jgi:hypothetical protein
MVANEGEPNSYGLADSVDPEGSISVITVNRGGTPSVATADFRAFNGQEDALRAQGVRIYGPNASAAQDLEPEYITVSADGSTAYVTLQENNAVAIVDIARATVSAIKPLGYKDHSLAGMGMDVSDEDGGSNTNSGTPAIKIAPVRVKGMYLPDAIASYTSGGKTYLVTANEGDARADWPGFNEETRVRAFCSAGLDPSVFADAANQILDSNLGRLRITSTPNGGSTGKNASGQCNELYSFGGRSFSIWDSTVSRVYDSGDEMEQRTQALANALQRQPRQQHPRRAQHRQGAGARGRGAGQLREQDLCLRGPGADRRRDGVPSAVLDQRGEAFHPVAVVAVQHTVDHAHFGVVDVPAHHPLHAARPCFARDGLFEVAHVADCALDLQLEVLAQAPVRQADARAQRIEVTVDAQGELIGPVAHVGQPPCALDDAVEVVAMRDPQLAAVGERVDVLVHHVHAAEVVAQILARELVVVARNEDHPGALARLAQELLHHVVVCLRPVPAAPQLPAVDDVADEKQRFAVHCAQEVQQRCGLAAGRAQMHVGYPHAAYTQ